MPSNQLNYIARYNKANYKMYQFRVKRSDVKLISFLDKKSNRNSYITGLISDDIDSGVLTIKQIKDMIRPVMLNHNIKDVYLFGSYARGEANKNSDVDIYCDSGDLKTLYDELDLIAELEAVLNKEVDVVTIGSKMDDVFKKQLQEDIIKLW